MPGFFKIGNNKVEFKKEPVAPEIQAENWLKVEAAIQKEKSRIVWLRPMLVAASFLLVAATSIWLFLKHENQNVYLTEVKTVSGEIKRITLPDGSTVVLNANSILKVPKVWKDNGKRNVWIEGEAYFTVAKKKVSADIFIVHTKDVDIEVLGTRFNVNTRNDQSTVALEEGKVQLAVKDVASSKASKKELPVVMKPGEVAVVNKNDVVKLDADSTINMYSGWARNEFHFNYTSMTEVARLIQDTYGYRVVISDSTLWQAKISGELRAGNIEDMAKVLEVILKRKITIKNKTLVIEQ
ncbi:FecR family protein [Pinibacter aurantiacus]|uniref:FecR domain-containing protein n=1 Tax=Pinibacter aurantiacus TaxID=2851599 RepID=A0A9E2SE57_9BACT|nr:FecR domain-containing protein [Pinibacter aurantiacus]MBV4359713.1 FecR domain-containing protein [Pinibacter aurantiacus]